MKLLIIEDELDFSQALARGLRKLGYAVDLAMDGIQGLELAETNEYDLLILDINLPGIDGFDVCRHLRTSQSNLLILMLTARGQLADRVTGLDLGADDYLVKPFHFEELVARLRALLRRDMRVREPIIELDDLKLDPGSYTVWKDNHRLELNRKEFGILEYLMRHPGEVVSQEELLEHVWESSVNPFSNAVRVHLTLLRRKLGDDAGKPHYIETVVGKGYRFLSPNQPERS